MNMEEKILQIPIENIIPNRFQPRLTFDETALQELAASIKEHGIIQPLVLRNLGDKYEIIAGERRFKASQMAGLKTVPAVISNIDDDKSAEVALVENIQRKNLTSIEEAKSYKNILDKGYLTQEQLAEKLGVSQSTIANKLRLLNLADEVQDALLKEKISERHARSLLAVKDPVEQVKWLNRILEERLTVRQLDIELKKEFKDTDNEDEDDSIPLVNLTPNINDIRENATDINVQQGLHDIESMLKPSIATEKDFSLSNPIDNVETLDFDNDTTETNEENIINDTPSEIISDTTINNPVESNKVPNKFFNFLEDEEANMNEENSIDDIFVTSPSSIEALDIDEDNTSEVVDSTPQILPESNVKVDQIEIPVGNNINTIEPEVNNTSESNKFFNFGNDTTIEESNNLINNNISDNNIIEVQEEKKEEDIFDPMNMVNTLEDDYQEKVEEEEGIDLKTAINSIRETKDLLEQKGFNITIDEADLGNSYTITINIIK